MCCFQVFALIAFKQQQKKCFHTVTERLQITVNAMRALLFSIVRSPLTLFLLLGSLLFAADRLLNGPNLDGLAERQEIRITSSQQQALREAFQAEHGRQPSTAELRAKLNFWIDEQILYREAMALNLDRADVVVRRQLAQKMRFLLEQGSDLKPATDAQLQAWLDAHPADYGTPAGISFDQIFLSRGRHGDALAGDAAKVMARLRTNPTDWALSSDPIATGLVITDATPMRLRADFGQDFANALLTVPVGAWTGPIASSLGLHFVRVTAHTAFTPAALATVRERVTADFETAERKRLSQAALQQLKARYQIHYEDAAS